MSQVISPTERLDAITAAARHALREPRLGWIRRGPSSVMFVRFEQGASGRAIVDPVTSWGTPSEAIAELSRILGAAQRGGGR